MNDLNVPSTIAQEQLRHASIATTLGIYTHAIPASHREAVEAVEERFQVWRRRPDLNRGWRFC